MDDRRDLTSGDPLAGGGPERPPGAPERPERPELPGAYGGGPVPPGAFVPRPSRPPAPAAGEVAEYWRRAVALLLDGMIVTLFVLVFFAVVGALVGDDGDTSQDSAWLAVLGLLIGFVLAYPVAALLYLSTMMAATNGQTLGRMATGIRVQRADGKPIGFWWAAYREVLMKGIVLGIAATITGGIAYLVDFLWPLWDRQNRTLHDVVVDSRVVKAR